jgi:hypothetical protein
VPAPVVAGEDGHHDEALHRRGQVLPDELGERVCLALQLERLALDLLVVLELDPEKPGHLDRGPGGAGDRHDRVVVRRVDLLDVARRHLVAHRREPVASDDRAVSEAQRDAGGAVRRLGELTELVEPTLHVRCEMRMLDCEELDEARALVAFPEPHLPPSSVLPRRSVRRAGGRPRGYWPPRWT